MKKTILSLSILSATAFLAGCGEQPAPVVQPATETPAQVTPPVDDLDLSDLSDLAGTTVHLFNWGLFLDPDLITQFQQETGINVIQSFYSSNEELHAVFTAGAQTFDLMIPSDYMVYRLIHENHLQPINMDNIPNIVHIAPYLMAHNFDPTNTYSVPYKWGTLGIAYNTTMVNHEVTSWDSLFKPEYADQILMYYSERDSFTVAFSRLGVSINTTDPLYIEQARDMLIAQRPLVQAYVTDQVINMMISGDAAMALVYSGDATWISYYNPDVRYVIPEEGSNIWINSLVIPANANNSAGAEAFINFLLRPDVAVANTNWVGYTTANLTARQSGDINPGFTSLDSFDVQYEDFARLESFIDLGPDRELITNAFIEVLASN